MSEPGVWSVNKCGNGPAVVITRPETALFETTRKSLSQAALALGLFLPLRPRK